MTWNELKGDTHRLYGKYSWQNLLMGILTSRTFRPIVTLRLCQQANRKGSRLCLPLLKMAHRLSCQLAGIDLSWEARLGRGFSLLHGWGTVISRGATIGENVTIFHGVTLGRRDLISPDGTRTIGYPTIEDEVCIGPNAIIVGNVIIGRGSRIAGGAFITMDIPEYSVVAGNPAAILKSNCIPDVANPAPNL